MGRLTRSKTNILVIFLRPTGLVFSPSARPCPQVVCQPPGAAEMLVCAAVLGESRRGRLPWRILVHLAPQLAAWAARVAMSPSCRPMALRASWRYAAWIESRFGPESAWDRPRSTDDFCPVLRLLTASKCPAAFFTGMRFPTRLTMSAERCLFRVPQNTRPVASAATYL